MLILSVFWRVRLALLLLLVKDYEGRHVHLPSVDPIEVVKLKMEEQGIKAKI